MSISSSLNAGVMGLNSNSSRLSAISDNIANSSTYGYKRSQVDFSSMVLQQQSSAYAAGGVRVTAFRRDVRCQRAARAAEVQPLAVKSRTHSSKKARSSAKRRPSSARTDPTPATMTIAIAANLRIRVFMSVSFERFVSDQKLNVVFAASMNHPSLSRCAFGLFA